MNFKDLEFKNLKDKNLDELLSLKKKVLRFLIDCRFSQVFSSLKDEKVISLAKRAIARIQTQMQILKNSGLSL